MAVRPLIAQMTVLLLAGTALADSAPKRPITTPLDACAAMLADERDKRFESDDVALAEHQKVVALEACLANVRSASIYGVGGVRYAVEHCPHA